MPRYRSPEERVGRAVLFPFKLIILLILLPLLVIAYPVVAVVLFFWAEGGLKHRVQTAVFWPLSLLALNELLSLGGLESKTLSRLTDWLNRFSSKR